MREMSRKNISREIIERKKYPKTGKTRKMSAKNISREIIRIEKIFKNKKTGKMSRKIFPGK